MKALLAALRRWAARNPRIARAMRAVGVVLRQWPWIFPAGIVVSAAKWIDKAQERGGWYARQRGDWYQILYPASVRTIAPPAGGPGSGRFRDHLFYRVPEAGVYCFRGAYLLSDEGAVLSRDNRLFAEFAHHFGVSALDEGRYFKPFCSFALDIERRAEWVALLASPDGRNHYHWLFDALPRLHLLEAFREQIELYAVSDSLSSVQKDMLARAGVAENRLLYLGRRGKLHCDRLLVPSLPGTVGAVPDWAIHYLRAQFIGQMDAPRGHRRIYISRSDAKHRRLTNEAAIIQLLKDRDFEVVELSGLSFEGQLNLFREARDIVACHGAGLANLVFADQCRVLEIFSPDYLQPDCYFTLSRQMGHSYHFLVGQKEQTGWGDITVAPVAVAEVVDRWA